MKVLILCGVFAKENEEEVMEHARGGVEFSANLFQQKLIDGFRGGGYDTQVLSAPFIGAYPMRSDLFRFKGFQKPQWDYQYVFFHNLWGIRNFSRSNALKRGIRRFVEDSDGDKLIVIYCPHTPFLEAAVYAKNLDPRIRICLYVPDLPNYMNLSEKRSWAYDFFKRFDVAAMNKLMTHVDSYALLTEQMKDILPIGAKPYAVFEGIIPDKTESPSTSSANEVSLETKIVYTGKMNRKFGIPELIGSFSYLKDPGYRLILCGQGDCDDYVAQACGQDPRIRQLGQLRPDEVKEILCEAAVLVNPRPNHEDYTKYSFPSKNIEYLLSGKPVVGYMLDGMPSAYASFLYMVDGGREDASRKIAGALERAIHDSAEEKSRRYRIFLEYSKKHLTTSSVAKAIVEMNKRD